MKNSIQKKRFRSNLETRFLCLNGLGFGDFWSRKYDSERFFYLPPMEYEVTIGLATGKMIFFSAYFHFLGLFMTQ
jgi:hypothetical protein